MPKNFLSEDDIEQALLQHLQHMHGYDVLDCGTAAADDLHDGSQRSDKRDVIFSVQLQCAVEKLNPSVPPAEIAKVVAHVMDRRLSISPIAANRALDILIRDGMAISFSDAQGVTQQALVRLIDFDDTSNNDYVAVSQLWIKASVQAPYAPYRRPDVILYVNGLPLVFIELKNAKTKLRAAYEDNLANYKHDIPQLFHCNAFCLLSNAIETKVGSFTAGWEHFFHWLRVHSEKESVNRQNLAQQQTSLETALAGLCQPEKLLDYVENFIFFYQEKQKIIAQNHQFLGVNHAFDRFLSRDKHQGKLGVFWHTQGSGKSFSMVFYARKIFRKVTGNFSFVVVTDRKDLDQQIYRNFLHTQTITEKEAAQPSNAAEMRKFLGLNKKVVFTLIQKFRFDKGRNYPALLDPKKDKREVIVMVDEAHRSQYKSLAQNMRVGLQGAHFLAFTGTPLLGKERKTSAWFGDYVSEYNFQQAMEDQATVPLFYEKRMPEVLIQNDDLSDDFYQLLADEQLDEAQQHKLEQRFARELQVIKRDDRLETIAKDMVYHFPRRGYLGKAMMVCVDKFTAVTMYQKVQYHWKAEIKRLRGRIKASDSDVEKAHVKKMIQYMKSVDMAVVISDPQANEAGFAQQGLDMQEHIQRLQQADSQGRTLEDHFKDPQHPLQLVFVCAMWLTGFDAPSVSTLYLDKPMKDHNLMQTIARANRVSPHQIKGFRGKWIEKKNGEIIDYYNVFRHMQQALSVYAQGEDDQADLPVQEKSELFVLLDDAIAQTLIFCREHKLELEAIDNQNNIFRNITLFQTYADQLLSKNDPYKSFFVYENTVSALYEACKPEILQQAPRPLIAIIQYLRDIIEQGIDQADIDAVCQCIAELLDESVVVDHSEGFTVREHHAQYHLSQQGKIWDLSTIDFEKLKSEFAQTAFKHLHITEMRAFIEQKLQQMLKKNHNRIDFFQRFQAIVERYNAGSTATEFYYDELQKFAKGMQEEDQRHVREGLSEDELELYDTLWQEKLSQAEEQKVKLAAKHLIHRLLEEHPKVLVQDWWKDGQSQRKVKSAVEEVLNADLPEAYTTQMFQEKTERVFNLIVDFAANGQKWVA